VINSIVINVLWKEIISCLWVHAGARTGVGEKSIQIRCFTFQNLVRNSCNAIHVTHLQVERIISVLDCWVHNNLK
jgi:hypothetical protein